MSFCRSSEFSFRYRLGVSATGRDFDFGGQALDPIGVRLLGRSHQAVLAKPVGIGHDLAHGQESKHRRAADLEEPAAQLVIADIEPFRPLPAAELIRRESRERGQNDEQDQARELEGAVHGADGLERIPSGHIAAR